MNSCEFTEDFIIRNRPHLLYLSSVTRSASAHCQGGDGFDSPAQTASLRLNNLHTAAMSDVRHY